jgi:hypothetical protein
MPDVRTTPDTSQVCTEAFRRCAQASDALLPSLG